MKKKKLKKIANDLLTDVEELEREVRNLRRFIPVFKNGLLGMELEVSDTGNELAGNPFNLTLEYEDRTERYSGLVHDKDVEAVDFGD